jgi:hypothetical protein
MKDIQMAISERKTLVVIPANDMIIIPIIKSINPSVNLQLLSLLFILDDKNNKDIPLIIINKPNIREKITIVLIGAEMVINPKMKVISPLIVSIHQFFKIAFMSNIPKLRL